MSSVLNPLVSIVIPCYNSEKTIEKCLDSLLDQTFKNWEALCINDGSSDSTLKVLMQYGKRDTRFKIYTQINSGAFHSRNKGVELSSGEFITFLDSDDSFEPLFLERAINNFHLDVDIVAVGVHYIGTKRKFHHPQTKLRLTYDKYLKNTLTGKYGWELWGKIYRRKLFCNVTNLPERINIGEDAYLLLQLILASKNIALIDIPLYNYSTRGSSISKNRSIQYAKETLRAASYITDMLRKHADRLVIENEIGAMNLLFYSNSSRRAILAPKSELVKRIIENHLTFDSLNLLPVGKRFYVLLLLVIAKIMEYFGVIKEPL